MEKKAISKLGLKEEKMNNLWWGYVHINGSLHAKRFFSYEDISDAQTSDFVLKVLGPFEVKDREEMLELLKEI